MKTTTIYYENGESELVKVIEWGGGSTPTLVLRLNGKVIRYGIDAIWYDHN